MLTIDPLRRTDFPAGFVNVNVVCSCRGKRDLGAVGSRASTGFLAAATERDSEIRGYRKVVATVFLRLWLHFPAHVTSSHFIPSLVILQYFRPGWSSSMISVVDDVANLMLLIRVTLSRLPLQTKFIFPQACTRTPSAEGLKKTVFARVTD